MVLPCFLAKSRRFRAARQQVPQRPARWWGGDAGTARLREPQEGDSSCTRSRGRGECAQAQAPQRSGAVTLTPAGAVRAFTGFARIKKGWQWQWQRQRPAGDGEPRLGSPNLTRAHMEPAHSSAPLSYFIAAPAACAPSFNPL